MIREAIIFRKSVYDKGYRCTLCDTLLEFGDNGGRQMLRCEDRLYCPCCHFEVGRLKQVDIPADAHGCLGDFAEYERRQKHD